MFIRELCKKHVALFFAELIPPLRLDYDAHLKKDVQSDRQFKSRKKTRLHFKSRLNQGLESPFLFFFLFFPDPNRIIIYLVIDSLANQLTDSCFVET